MMRSGACGRSDRAPTTLVNCETAAKGGNDRLRWATSSATSRAIAYSSRARTTTTRTFEPLAQIWRSVPSSPGSQRSEIPSLMKLQSVGVGYKSVSAVSGTAAGVLHRMMRAQNIRRPTTTLRDSARRRKPSRPCIMKRERL